MKIVKLLLAGLVLLIAIAVIAYVSRIPDYGFTLQTSGVSAPVEVIFDDIGVPHIVAENEPDAMFALGHVHASERLWQMDLMRRAGAGELAALLGRDMVENDKYLRTLGMREAARRTAGQFREQAPEHVRVAMEAYLAGINAFIADGQTPLEYLLVGQDPEPFDTEDVYCATCYMAYSFAIHLKTEPILDWMKQNLEAALWAELAVDTRGFRTIPVAAVSDSVEAKGTVGSWGEAAGDISALSARVHALDEVRPVPQWLGSNAWVISGERTQSGEVLLCNDAHMGYGQPSVWYEAHVSTPEIDYYGNHLAGIPFPAIGHTRHHAWGITMFVNDDIDLYRETIEGDRYLHGGEWLPVETHVDTILVAGEQAPVTFEIRKTHHGPLIADNLAMWWTFTQYPENRLHEAFYAFSRQEGLANFEAAAAMVHAPGLNLMYGDEDGNIGWWAAAKLPIRPPSLDTKTAINGTDPSLDPAGWHPFERNPHNVNPASGFVYSANNAPDSVAGIQYPGHYYAGNTRGAGIMDALSARSDWTLAEAQALQLDHHSPVYRENAKRMLELSPAASSEARGLLAGWDGSHLGSDLEPTLYYRWMYRTIEGAMADEFMATGVSDAREKFTTWHKTIVSENTFPRLLANPESPWWDDATTDGRESAEDIVTAALDLAVADLSAALGADVTGWRYDRLHVVTHEHAMKDVPVLGGWLGVGPFGLPAAKDALNKYEFKLKEEVDYTVFSGPSMRIGIDFADVDAAESILPTGQSGNRFSPFYDDQAQRYHTGQFRQQRMDRADIAAHAHATARFVP